MKKGSHEAKFQILQYRYRLNRWERLFITGALLITLAFMGFLFVNELQRVHQAEESAFILRANLLEEFINSRRSFVDGMARLTRQNMEQPFDPSFIKNIKDYPEYGVYAIGGPDISGEIEKWYVGSLTGIGEKTDLDLSILKEIQAVLALDPLLTAQFSNDPELIWAYYTSMREFLYLAPGVSVKDYHFSTDEYKKEFWFQAIPPANPYLRTIVSSLYVDAVGKGEMISISKPVLVGTEIIGVVSADIGVKSLQDILKIGNSAGHTIILDQHGKLIASGSTSHACHLEDITLSAITEKPQFFRDGWWIKKSVADGSIYILHHQQLSVTIWQTVKNTIHLPFILLLLVGMTYLLLKLRRALHLVTDAMRTDPLTGLLNRRGFFEDVSQLMGLCRRQEIQLSVMMLDIDHFKGVKDKFGDGVGDTVLIELAALL